MREQNLREVPEIASGGPGNYTCALQALVTSWREAFGVASNASFYFGIYRLAPRCGRDVMRQGTVETHKITGTISRASAASRRARASLSTLLTPLCLHACMRSAGGANGCF